MKKTAMVSIKKRALSGIIFSLTFGIAAFSIVSISEAAKSLTIDGAYLLSLPMPGGAKESIIMLVSDGEKVTGAMSEPGNPSEVSPIQDGSYIDGKLTFSAGIGRITYILEGSLTGDTLMLDMTTQETIPLDDGHRLSGKTGDITGSYLIPVYSPGGIKENQVELVAEDGIITGEMYSSGDSGGPPEGMGGAPGNMVTPPGGRGPEGGEASGAGINDSTDGKRDLNIFFDSTYEGNNISLFTKTAQGSIFHFIGAVEGDTIKLTMHVTDKSSGIEAKKK